MKARELVGRVQMTTRPMQTLRFRKGRGIRKTYAALDVKGSSLRKKLARKAKRNRGPMDIFGGISTRKK